MHRDYKKMTRRQTATLALAFPAVKKKRHAQPPNARDGGSDKSIHQVGSTALVETRVIGVRHTRPRAQYLRQGTKHALRTTSCTAAFACCNRLWHNREGDRKAGQLYRSDSTHHPDQGQPEKNTAASCHSRLLVYAILAILTRCQVLSR